MTELLDTHVQQKGFFVDEDVQLLKDWSVQSPNLNIIEALWGELNKQMFQ